MCASLWNSKSALILLMHSTNMKIIHVGSSSLCRLCYFLCVIPFQESLFSRLVTYTNEQPWLWAVYVIVIGLPIVLVLVFCCGSSSQVSASLLYG
jgi:hypothetical protein